uniref:Uncharacterized protein n=1 Tax=Siphoviridae sp. ctv4j104 TaxID=2826510 RepID=A0A8S5M9N9_9CAUD|nr:MAG TPA: hypothetical protein [Siphoviridae sp. ctv4j104]
MDNNDIQATRDISGTKHISFRQLMRRWKIEAGVHGDVLIGLHGMNEGDKFVRTLTITTNEVGLMLGVCGERVIKYKQMINSHRTEDNEMIDDIGGVDIINFIESKWKV